MRSRPEPADPATTQLLLDRLHAVLQENGPRRAAAPQTAHLSEISDRGQANREPSPPAGHPPPKDAPTVADARTPSRRGFGRMQVGVIAALVLVGLLCTGWAVLRARPVGLSTPLPVTEATAPTSAFPDPGEGAGSATPSAAAMIMVHVLGAVRQPGVLTLPERARVRDALDAAGGLRSNADAAELNLAQVLQDGQQLLIGTSRDPAGTVRGGSGPGPAGDAGGTSTSGGGQVLDLNSATEAELDQLPGVGPVTAGKILAWRTEHERFSRVEELQEVDGIGPKTYAEISPHVRV